MHLDKVLSSVKSVPLRKSQLFATKLQQFTQIHFTQVISNSSHIYTLMKRLILLCLLSSFSICFGQVIPISAEANDCLNAIPICTNTDYNLGTTTTQGDDCDVTAANNGCLIYDPYPTGSAEEVFCRYEYSPTWFYFRINDISMGSTVELLIDNSGADSDYALWGPITDGMFANNDATDPSNFCDFVHNNTPIRCNTCAQPGQPTGFATRPGPCVNSSTAGGGCKVVNCPLTNVQVGEVYVLLVQQWGHPPSPVGFDLWLNGGTGSSAANSTAAFDCSITGVMSINNHLTAKVQNSIVELELIAQDNDQVEQYNLYRSDSALKFEPISRQISRNSENVYAFTDRLQSTGKYHYYVEQIYHDGAIEKSNIVTVSYHQTQADPYLVEVRTLTGRIVIEPYPVNTVLIKKWSDHTATPFIIVK